MNLIRAGHGESAPLITQTVVGLVLDGRPGRLFFHRLRQAASLEDKTGDDPVKDGPIEEPFIHIVKKVFRCHRRLFGEELDGDLTE